MPRVHKCQYCGRDDFKTRHLMLTHESVSRRRGGCHNKLGDPSAKKREKTITKKIEKNEVQKDEQYGYDNTPITLEEIENHWT